MPDTGEPRIVQKVRGQFASWAAVSLGCLGINVATGIDHPWFLFPLFGMGIGLFRNYAQLWQAGYSWRDVLSRPPAPDAVETTMARGIKGARQLAAPRLEEYGAHLPAVQQVHGDRQAILKLMERLPPSERKMLPEIQQTADSLYDRATDLARTLQAMDSNFDMKGMPQIDERIAALCAGARRSRAGAAAQSARAAAADHHRSAGPADPGGQPPRVVRAGDAEHAVRPAAPAIGGGRRGAGRSHPGHATGQGPLARRGQCDCGGGGDQRGDAAVLERRYLDHRALQRCPSAAG